MNKHSALLFFSILLVFNLNAQSSINEPNLDKEFEKLVEIESYVNQHPCVTLSEIKSKSPEVLNEIKFEENQNSTAFLVSSDTMGIPPFWWGFCLGFWGILIVYIISDNDKAATKKALNGCIVATASVLGLYVILFAAGVFAASSTYWY